MATWGPLDIWACSQPGLACGVGARRGRGGTDGLAGAVALPLVPRELPQVFSFLEARDLLCAAQVDKVWYEVSKTKDLWRQLCLRCWSSCKASRMTLGTQTWKQYYLCRSELEFRMESGRPEKDFTCKALARHKGRGRGMW
ncbi:F-box/WD repeat-containing protein 15-like [Equus quagga]|uniref:F-box/WD repeat-containing protein 15-like n=1 Tax=Equus quagga TaxID=89248 RepID=UPI001EE27A5A|nr:F-box/WD repeat-containing protein 15-like [Equus quagga]